MAVGVIHGERASSDVARGDVGRRFGVMHA